MMRVMWVMFAVMMMFGMASADDPDIMCEENDPYLIVREMQSTVDEALLAMRSIQYSANKKLTKLLKRKRHPMPIETLLGIQREIDYAVTEASHIFEYGGIYSMSERAVGFAKMISSLYTVAIGYIQIDAIATRGKGLYSPSELLAVVLHIENIIKKVTEEKKCEPKGSAYNDLVSGKTKR